MGTATLDSNEVVQWVHRSHVCMRLYTIGCTRNMCSSPHLIARFIDDLMCILEVGGEDGMDDNEVDNLIQDLDTFGQGTLT
jgi:hypothetical protein